MGIPSGPQVSDLLLPIWAPHMCVGWDRNFNSSTAHYIDGWRRGFSQHSFSRQGVHGNTVAVPSGAKPNEAEQHRLKRASGKGAGEGLSNQNGLRVELDV
ncbi:hypothetical protein CRENBAI_008324 [Crenichthys baileyi]|uniref:Uncharacterized protein n=1 Tax=Crenichthys baileyi TaxID=28760 RepID=A0AAV9QM36_9TELE